MALVMSVWRNFKKSSNAGAQLHCNEMSRGALHSARVLLLKKPQEHLYPDLYVANSSCVAMVVPSSCIGFRLDTPDMSSKKGIDGIQFIIPKDRSWLFLFFDAFLVYF